METPGTPPNPPSDQPGSGPPDQPPPGGPQSPAPVPGSPQSPVPGGAPPPPSGPQSPTQPGPEGPPSSYGGPVPPGGWQAPAGPPAQQQAWVGKPLASWGSRLGAYLIDVLVLLIPGLILFFVLVAGAVGITGDEDVAAGAAIGAIILWLVLMAIVGLLYAPLLMARKGGGNGQTWGKQVLSIRAVRDSGEPFGFGSAAVREIVLKFLAVGIASSIIPLIPWILNFFWPLWDDQNRALHDMAASTHVVQA